MSLIAVCSAMFVIVVVVALLVYRYEQKGDEPTPILYYTSKPLKYERRICEDCGRMVSIRKDGHIHARHRCHLPSEAA